MCVAEGDAGQEDGDEREEDAEGAGVEAVEQAADDDGGEGQAAQALTSSTPRIAGFAFPPQQTSQ